MKKNIRNADTMSCKLSPAVIKVSNYRLENALKEGQKREKMVKK